METSRARIWDLPTRLFHWFLVIFVVVAAFTGFFGPANVLNVHVWAGYGIAALIGGRLIWGVFGSEYSRLDRMYRALRHLGEHATGLLRLRPKHYVGHNPAGSLMILALLLVLSGIVGTGLVVLGGAEKQGVLAGVTPYAIGHLAKRAHQILTYALGVMVLGHLAGVATEMLLLHVPLIQGMVTGWLPTPAGAATEPLRQARPLLALVSAMIAACAVGVSLLPLASLPGLGVPGPLGTGTYARECGACHWPFHPSLLPRQSWELTMATLDQHFGEDASLPRKATAEIAAFLRVNAAETADTEPANRFREVSASDRTRITATRFWLRTHHDLPEQVFKSAAVKSKTNCVACHRDALTGRFDDQQIDVPSAAQTGDKK